MSSQGIASAIKRRTRPPEDPRKTASLSSQQQSSSPGNSKLSVNPMQILYSHEMKIKKMEEQLTNNGSSNNTNTNTNTNTNNTISRDEISGLVTSVLDTKLKDIDFQYSEKINKINHNMGVLVKNIETISKNFGTLNNGLGQYKKENEERIGNLFNSFKDLNGVLSQNLEYTKELASMRETIKQDILNELATTSEEVKSEATTEAEEATTEAEEATTEAEEAKTEAEEVKTEAEEVTTEETTTLEEEVKTEESTTLEEEVKPEVESELKVEEEVKPEEKEVKTEAEEVKTEEENVKVESELKVEDKSMTVDISIPTPKTQRKGKR